MAEDTLHPSSELSDNSPSGKGAANGTTTHPHYAADPEAQEMVVDSLRTQIQDLFTQVTQLNSKLVKSYDRVSDLEDELHIASAQLRASSVKVSSLELERTQHLAALNTGLLVEKHHVTTELNRLMEKATEEAAQRGQAESARAAIEKELDDLSASLFNQANTMVAEARYAQHISDRKAEEAEVASKGAEEAVSAMQLQVQTLQQEKELAERKATEIQNLMGKGKWIEKQGTQASLPPLHLLNSHLPFQELLLFVAHVRHLHMTSPQPPPMSTLLPLPLLARLSTEDSEPTIRLDLAPSLNWLSRRSVLAAIHNGQLIIEPVPSATLLTDPSLLSNAGISGLTSNYENIPCALCGMPIFAQAPFTNTSPTRPPPHTPISMGHSSSGSGSSWSTSLFKKNANNLNASTNSQTPLSIPPRSISHTSPLSSISTHPSQVYIFRISSSQTSTITSIPLLRTSSTAAAPSTPSIPAPSSSRQSNSTPTRSAAHNATPSQSTSTIYPLCTSGWCLARIRTTCSLWAFVRAGIIEKIWEEPMPVVLPPPAPTRQSSATASGSTNINGNINGATEKPPIPPRRRGLWGFASAIGEKAASWSESVSDKDKAKKASVSVAEEKKDAKKLPPPPPTHPQERLHSEAATTLSKTATPPPLPKRSEVRARTPINQPPTTTPSPAPVESAPTLTPTPPQAAPDASEEPPALDPDSPKKEPPTSTSPPPVPSIPPRAAKRLSASLGRPGTPSNIPLPESRPSTPASPGAPNTANAPSRTSTPALGTIPTTPPPIPRRAVGRTPRKLTGEGDSRPGSPAVPAVSTSPSAPPAKDGDEQPQSQSQLDSVKETVEEGAQGTKDSAGNGINGVETTEVPKAIEEVPTKESSASSEAGEFVDAVNGDETQGEGEKLEQVESGKEQKEEKEDETKNGETKEAPAKVKEEAVISLNDADLPPPLPPRKSQEVSRAETESKMDTEVNGVKTTEDGEGESQMYVGDATWEERTWKELVRLREEMFLAKIGAIRS